MVAQCAHRLQMYEARQLHEIPENEEDRYVSADACGFRGQDAVRNFLRHHGIVRERVRRRQPSLP